ncbi:MAG TPA: DUF2809 domain-containing protein [Flavisolibacter sp.]|nr:DUF2809 domain-containing protein [Flavisolibacter sp.]
MLSFLFLRMFTFRAIYFFFALALFLVEVLIALYINDRFVRPYVGDFLVVMLLYCAVQAVVQTSVQKAAMGVLLFAYGVEVLQGIKLINILGLQNNTLAKTILGTSFEWMDMLAYTLGIFTVLFLERVKPVPPRKAVVRNQNHRRSP